MSWLEIVHYCDFYDVPHRILVKRNGALYAFDCPFDEEADEYGAYYEVFRLPEDVPESVAQQSTRWKAILRLGTRLGTVPVSAVRFDASRRHAVHEEPFEAFRVSCPSLRGSRGRRRRSER